VLYQNEVYIDSFNTRKDQFVIEVTNPDYNFPEKIKGVLQFYEYNFDISRIDKYFKGNTVPENEKGNQAGKFAKIFLYNYSIFSSDTLVSGAIHKLLSLEETLVFAPFEFEFVSAAIKLLSVENLSDDNQKIAYSILKSWNGISNAELQAPLIAETWVNEFYKRKFHEFFSLDSYFLMRNLYGFPFTFAEFMIRNQNPSDPVNYFTSTSNLKDVVQSSFNNAISLLEQKFGENIVVWQLKKIRMKNLAHISHTNFDDLGGALSSICFYDEITETGSAAIFVELNGSLFLKTFNRENFFHSDLPTSAVLNLSHIGTGKKAKLSLVLF
ncbi:MAG: penicillin acylase family protein, partial [Ignavibacteriaceae bacterium]|nr:penicillin acylase family protein [Ignavibacteriaceae bacterium]